MPASTHPSIKVSLFQIRIVLAALHIVCCGLTHSSSRQVLKGDSIPPGVKRQIFKRLVMTNHSQTWWFNVTVNGWSGF